MVIDFFVLYIDMQGHIANCDFADIKCINPGCNKTMPRTELKEHKFTCQFRNIRCQWCHREIQANNRKVAIIIYYVFYCM